MITSTLAQAGAEASTAIPRNADGMFEENLHHMANYFVYSPMQYHAVSHILTLGFGVFAAALLYFTLTIRQLAPRYRPSSALSCVVSVSALLILANQAIVWQQSFTYQPELGGYARAAEHMFSNGFRYMNWAIDVPHLLLTMLVVAPLANFQQKKSYGVQFVVAGLIMILCSWLGSFWEQGYQVEGVNPVGFWINYIIGWLAYLWILVVVFRVVAEAKQQLPPEASSLMSVVLGLLVVAWTVYAFVLIQPIVWWSPESVVTRQVLFTLADITSKAIYGVLLGQIAMVVSRHEGYDPATQSFHDRAPTVPGPSV